MPTVIARVCEKTVVNLVRGGTNRLIVNFHNHRVGGFGLESIGFMRAQCPGTVVRANVVNSDTISIEINNKLSDEQLLCIGRAAARVGGLDLEVDEVEFCFVDGRSALARRLKALQK